MDPHIRRRPRRLLALPVALVLVPLGCSWSYTGERTLDCGSPEELAEFLAGEVDDSDRPLTWRRLLLESPECAPVFEALCDRSDLLTETTRPICGDRAG